MIMPNDIRISIAAGEALLFLEHSRGPVSVESFEHFLKGTGLNVYLIFKLLLFERLISLEGGSVVLPKRTMNYAGAKV
jgi:hypothetical protein